jgi:hypothetical protein
MTQEIRGTPKVQKVFADLDDTVLVNTWASFRESEDHYREQRERVEMELHHRLEAREATMVEHETLSVKRVPIAAVYNVESFIAHVKELVSPAAWAMAYMPERPGRPLPPSVDGRVIQHWPKAYGREVREAMDKARLPGATHRLKITAKEPV